MAKMPNRLFCSGDGSTFQVPLPSECAISAVPDCEKPTTHTSVLPEPPPARFVASVACFIVGKPAHSAGREIAIDGETIAIRELAIPALRVTDSGPIELYVRLALLLGGTPYSGPAIAARDRVGREQPGTLGDASFPLLRLEPLADADPFAGETVPLGDPELLEVYPIERHLFSFVDAFRRAYLPQRGRL